MRLKPRNHHCAEHFAKCVVIEENSEITSDTLQYMFRHNTREIVVTRSESPVAIITPNIGVIAQHQKLPAGMVCLPYSIITVSIVPLAELVIMATQGEVAISFALEKDSEPVVLVPTTPRHYTIPPRAIILYGNDDMRICYQFYLDCPGGARQGRALTYEQFANKERTRRYA